MLGGGIMRKRPITILSIFMIIIMISIFTTTLADEEEIIWNGYDVEILNTYDIQLIGQNLTIEINEDKLVYNGEYVIKNFTQNTLEAILGLPSNNLENMQITEKSNIVKHYSRNKSYITDRFPSDTLPDVSRWYTASLWFKAGETKIINVRYETKLKNNNKGVYSIRYHRNKDLIYSDASAVVLSLYDFYPYNVLNTIGVEEEKTVLSGNKRLTMEMSKGRDMLGLEYELVDKLSIDRFDFSSDKKLKNIAASFRKKDYEAVNTLCDEYLKNPTDPTFNSNQINYIKAETYRKQADYSKYIEYVKDLNLDALYPSRLKYKILYDLAQIIQQDTIDIKLLDVMRDIQTQAKDSNEYIGKWMEMTGKNYIEAVETIEQQKPQQNIEKENFIDKTIALFKLENLLEKIKGVKYFSVILIAVSIIVSFIAGYISGRRKMKRKNTISYYKFHR